VNEWVNEWMSAWMNEWPPWRRIEIESTTARVHAVDDRAKVKNGHARIARARGHARGVEPRVRIRTTQTNPRVSEFKEGKTTFYRTTATTRGLWQGRWQKRDDDEMGTFFDARTRDAHFRFEAHARENRASDDDDASTQHRMNVPLERVSSRVFAIDRWRRGHHRCVRTRVSVTSTRVITLVARAWIIFVYGKSPVIYPLPLFVAFGRPATRQSTISPFLVRSCEFCAMSSQALVVKT
jgi:hypothetical protein